MNAPPPKPVAALAIAPIEDADAADVVALWQRCGLTRPWNDPAADIVLARKEANATVLVGRDGGAIVATDPERRGKGHGRAIMAAAEDWLRQTGIAKMQLMVRRENAAAGAFYQSIGYAEAQTIVFARWLDGREPTP